MILNLFVCYSNLGQFQRSYITNQKIFVVFIEYLFLIQVHLTLAKVCNAIYLLFSRRNFQTAFEIKSTFIIRGTQHQTKSPSRERASHYFSFYISIFYLSLSRYTHAQSVIIIHIQIYIFVFVFVHVCIYQRRLVHIHKERI